MKKIFLLSLLLFQPVFAEMTCDIAVVDYYALYKLSVYTCNAGDFLPANAISCVQCPNGFTCPGGTFTFNSDSFQGLDFTVATGTQMNNLCATNFPSDLMAIYTPNIHTCSAGYYLPAGVDACTLCPANSACVGGRYSFNEVVDQGVAVCGTGTFAPTGSSVCYPHILHVGDDVIYVRSTKLTTPSLNIKVGNDIFYISTTTTRTRMNKDSSHYFHIDYGDNRYYLCDDTTCPQ